MYLFIKLAITWRKQNYMKLLHRNTSWLWPICGSAQICYVRAGKTLVASLNDLHKIVGKVKTCFIGWNGFGVGNRPLLKRTNPVRGLTPVSVSSAVSKVSQLITPWITDLLDNSGALCAYWRRLASESRFTLTRHRRNEVEIVMPTDEMCITVAILLRVGKSFMI